MAYPYSHRNRAMGFDTIQVYKLGTDSGTPVTTVSTVAQTITMEINPAYNAWSIGYNAWATGCDQDITIQVEPYVDHQQNLAGGPMYLAEYGGTNVTTSITISAQTATGVAGHVARVIPSGVGGVESAAPDASLLAAHGFRVTATITVASTRGSLDLEVIIVPEA